MSLVVQVVFLDLADRNWGGAVWQGVLKLGLNMRSLLGHPEGWRSCWLATRKKLAFVWP